MSSHEDVSELTKDNPITLLGKRVKDALTGLQGICGSVTEKANGNFVIAIHPPAKEDGTMCEAYSFDLNMIDIVDEGISSRVIYPKIESKFKIGDVVQHNKSEFSGTVHNVIYYGNGCTQYCVTPEHLDQDGKVVFEYFEEESLEKIGDNFKVQETQKTRTGGPIERAPRQR